MSIFENDIRGNFEKISDIELCNFLCTKLLSFNFTVVKSHLFHECADRHTDYVSFGSINAGFNFHSPYNILFISYLLLTLKIPRKTTSENVVCLCRLLHLLANFSNIPFAKRQTLWTQIRLLLIWVHTVCKLSFKIASQMTKQTTIVVMGSLRVKLSERQ